MIIKSVALFLLFLLVGCGQQATQQNSKVVAETHQNGETSKVILDNSQSGHAVRYYKSGKIKRKVNIHEGKNHGAAQVWHENGTLKESGTFNKGQKNGSWKLFYPAGKLKREQYFKDGMLTGLETHYREDGTKSEEITYKTQQDRTERTTFSKDGTPWYRSEHQGGEMVREINFDDDGQIDTDLQYLNNKLHGTRTEYVKGLPVLKAEYQQGKLHGKKIMYYSGGQKKSEEHYLTGKHSGIYTEWFNNGKRKSEKNYSEGILNGSWQEWYDNGDLKVNGEYDQNRIIRETHFPPKTISTHSVSTTRQLLETLGKYRRIILKKGTYNLSEIQITGDVFECDKTLHLFGCDGLTLEGEAPGTIRIVVSDPAATVISISSSVYVTLKNLDIGHQVRASAECISGVLRVKQCQNMEIETCVLFGSGTHGLDLTYVSQLQVKGSEITDCSECLMIIHGSSKLHFLNSEFTKTGQFALIPITESSGIFFNQCVFSDNWSSDSLFKIMKSTDIHVVQSEIKHNLVPLLCNQAKGIDFTGTRYDNNEFLAKGESPDPRLKELLAAVSGNQLQQVDQWIKSEVNLNSRRDMTPLGASVSLYNRVNPEMIKKLLAAGADPNVRVKSGSESGDFPIQSLIKSPLHLLCEYIPDKQDSEALKKRIISTRYLLENGANVNIEDDQNLTPLNYAVLAGSAQMVRLLVSYHAEINPAHSLLIGALINNHVEIALFLIESGADVNAKNEDGNTPLHLVVSPNGFAYLGSIPLNARLRLVEKLMSRGADPHLKNTNGLSAYQKAKMAGEPDMLKLLEKKN